MTFNCTMDNTTGWSGTNDTKSHACATTVPRTGAPASLQNMTTLLTSSGWATTPLEKSLKISPDQYQLFKREFTFDALRGQTFGRSFLAHFDLWDNLLFITADPYWCDQYICQTYVSG